MNELHRNEDKQIRNAFQERENKILIQRTRIASYLLIICGMGTGLIDPFVYPDAAKLLFIDRACFTLFVIFILCLTYTTAGKKNTRILAMSFIYTLLAAHGIMLLFTGGYTSTYYIGFPIILLLGISLLFPLSAKECISTCLVSLLLYFGICSIELYFNGSHAVNWNRTFISNTVFLIDFLLIISVSGFFTFKLRFHDFELQYELDQNKKHLENSYRKLEELDNAKSKFFANISHELRTPLTLILSPLEQIRKDQNLTANAKVKDTLDLMFSNAMRLLSLINDLLDLVRMEEGKIALKFTTFNLNELLSGLVSSVKHAAENKQLAVKFIEKDSTPVLINADKDKIEKGFLNILFNAIKFTPKNGIIDIVISSENDDALIDIIDNGIGIDSNKLGSVFNRFWQDEDSAVSTKQGTGIGLALAKEIVDLHGGTIDVSSTKGKGTTFTIKLKKSNDSVPDDTSAAEVNDAWLSNLYKRAKHYQLNETPVDTTLIADQTSKSDFLKHTLLLVEDEPDMQRFLKSELIDKYNIISAGDGAEGLKLAEEYQPDLVLTDYTLPNMDGITLCKRIKSSPILLPTKIILVTARADDQTKIKALEAGVDDFLAKPFSTTELKTRLANILLNSQLERELQNQNQVLENTLRQLQETESQLIQAERLSALGHLSAGIMHEINNPVNFMMTAISFLRSDLEDPTPDVVETIDDIEGGLKRVRDIISDLKGFAYGNSDNIKEECSLKTVIDTAKRLLADEITEDISINVSTDQDDFVIGNHNQLTQLFVNLMQNSIQATRQNVEKRKNRQINIKICTDKNYSIISIRDNGCGIEDKISANIFDPFFTTKDVGEGTGLGLSICHTIIKKHNGEISVNSQPDDYTEFIIKLSASTPSTHESFVLETHTA